MTPDLADLRGALVLVVTGVFFGLCPNAGAVANDRYIVLLDDAAVHPARIADRHAENRGPRVNSVFRTVLKGYAAQMTSAQAAAIRKDPAVAAIGPDPVGESAGQTTPVDLARTFAATNASIFGALKKDDQRVDADVAVLDTGIIDSPELNVVARVNCFGIDPEPEDAEPADYSNCVEGEGRTSLPDPEELEDFELHGTVVAAAIAAIDNEIGGSDVFWPLRYLGIAPGARLWAVQVADLDIRTPPPATRGPRSPARSRPGSRT